MTLYKMLNYFQISLLEFMEGDLYTLEWEAWLAGLIHPKGGGLLKTFPHNDTASTMFDLKMVSSPLWLISDKQIHYVTRLGTDNSISKVVSRKNNLSFLLRRTFSLEPESYFMPKWQGLKSANNVCLFILFVL